MSTRIDQNPDAAPAEDRGLPGRFPVLPVGISAIDIPRAVDVITEWIDRRERHYINVCTSDTTVKCYDDPRLADIVNDAGMATPDGMPLVWLGRAKGHTVSRVYGPDLMLAVCGQGQGAGFKHFFYGATDQVLQDLVARLHGKFPDLQVAGTYSPPYRELSEEEKRADARMIDASGADIVWVGLGTPKQDYWVGQFRPLLEAPVLIAIGAAFDFHAGRIRQAPRWMMRCGLEWLFRLCLEPRRLWRRYIIGNPRFIYLILRQVLTGNPASPWGRLSGSRDGTKSPATPEPCSETRREERETSEAAAKTEPASGRRPRVNVLGVGVNAINMSEALSVLLEAARSKEKGYVCVAGVHGVIESRSDAELRRIHNCSLLTVPDGMPTVWTGRGQGYTRMGRVYGPELMLNLCRESGRDFTHFFYGATPETLEKLVENLEKECPGLRVAGSYSPPFRPLNPGELEDLKRRIAEARPDFFWVGLGTPKQERFMAEHLDQLDTSVMLGTGAAFDIHAGLKKDAPAWIKKSGLQWLHRLCQEPGRLWQRYLHIVPLFLWLSLLQMLGLKTYQMDEDHAT